MKKRKKNDLLPEDVVKFREIERIFINNCHQFGYKEIKTSSLEPLYLFTVNNTLAPEVLKSVYSFLDWGGWSGERVALRPDLTISAARYYLDYLLKDQQAKIFYVENLFLLDDSGQELSERWQFGIENIGDPSHLADVEAIFMANDILRAVGLEDISLKLSFPMIILECLNITFDKEKERQEALRIIKCQRLDEIESIRVDADIDILKRLLFFKGSNVAFLNNLKSDLHRYERVVALIDRFSEVCKKLDLLDCPYEINFSLSRDIEYYTGIQFQILSEPEKSKHCILCSGGRYDNLVSKLGNLNENIASIGFAFYIKNIIEQLSDKKEKLQNIAVVVNNLTYQNMNTAKSLCRKFKHLGFSSFITIHGIPDTRFKEFGLIVEVCHDMYKEGYRIIHSSQIDKSLLQDVLNEVFAIE